MFKLTFDPGLFERRVIERRVIERRVIERRVIERRVNLLSNTLTPSSQTKRSDHISYLISTNL